VWHVHIGAWFERVPDNSGGPAGDRARAGAASNDGQDRGCEPGARYNDVIDG
jgi:hypothetical protein